VQALLSMELAGLEPATSWVRFGRAPHSNHANLQGFRPALAGSAGQNARQMSAITGSLPPENAASGANAHAEMEGPPAVPGPGRSGRQCTYAEPHDAIHRAAFDGPLALERTEVAMMQTPDGNGRLELVNFHSPSNQGDNRHEMLRLPIKVETLRTP
jgi:hypothetical protein